MTVVNPASVEEAFADTCILLGFVQREFESSAAPDLVESDDVDLVVTDAVLEELEAVTDRRDDIYVDLMDFLLNEEDAIEGYEPSDRRVYFAENDGKHLRDLQMSLSQLDEPAVIKPQLRRYLREVERRTAHIKDKYEDDVVVPLGSLLLELDIARVIDNDADARILANAAGWAADGGSGVLVTLDSQDFFEQETAIADMLREEKGSDWVVTFCLPRKLLQHRQ